MAEASVRIIEMLHRQVADLARRAGLKIPVPASDAEIDEAQAALGGRIPPSYCRLLRLQNGWPKVWQGFWLASTSGLQGKSKSIARLLKIWWRAHGIDASDAAACAGYDAPEGDMVPWRHIVCGFSKSGELLVFDTDQTDADGEMPLVRVHPQAGVICSWPNLEEWMVAATAEGLEVEDGLESDGELLEDDGLE